MAPQTKADASTSAKMRDIKRTVWEARTGITLRAGEELDGRATVGERRWLKRRSNKNPKVNREIELREFKLPDGEMTNRIFIADSWPTDPGWEERELLRRQVNGQGPVIGHTEIPLPGGGVKFVDIFAPTKKRWTRTERRVKAAIGRGARRRNAMAARKPVKKLRALGTGNGPTPRNPANKTKQKEAAEA